jgi:hypothetical protein
MGTIFLTSLTQLNEISAIKPFAIKHFNVNFNLKKKDFLPKDLVFLRNPKSD